MAAKAQFELNRGACASGLRNVHRRGSRVYIDPTDWKRLYRCAAQGGNTFDCAEGAALAVSAMHDAASAAAHVEAAYEAPGSTDAGRLASLPAAELQVEARAMSHDIRCWLHKSRGLHC